MKRVVRIFPYEANKFEVVVEDGNQIVYDLIVDQVEMYDGEGVLVVETDGDVFVLSAHEYDKFLKGFDVLN